MPIKKYAQNLKHLIELELENTLLISTLFLGLGIYLFFSLPYDPSLTFCLCQFLVAISLLMIFRKHYICNRLSVLLFMMSVGFLAAEIRVINISSPQIKSVIENVAVEGTILQIIDSPNNRKLLLDNLIIENLDSNQTPSSIRISTKSDLSDYAVGDRIYLTTTLMPPPHPSFPGGFNFAEYSFFKEIGAIGFAQSRPYNLSLNNIDTATKHINNLRKYLGRRIERAIDSKSSAIALALLIGDTTKIDKHSLNVVRISGIAHIIAISGLHVVIVVGLIFLSIRGMLSKFSNLAAVYDLKKIAAIFGIIGSFCYLIIAGSPISAQRAFIMSTITLVAILIDRTPKPIRSIAFAGIIILLLTPESMFSASMQMSFAACISLVASFTYLSKVFWPDQSTHLKKVLVYLLNTVISTLVAGSATAPFVIYHFNQFSTYSILTNIIAVPLTNFILMPLGAVGLLLIPFHLESLALIPMGWGIDFMIYVADIITSLPQSSLNFRSYTTWGLGLIASGGLLFCIMVAHLRWAAAILLLVGMLSNATFFKGNNPDILIDSSGKLFALRVEDSYYFSNKMRARFVRNSWEQLLGVEDVSTIKKLSNCTQGVCTLSKNGQSITVVSSDDFAAWNEGICSDHSMIINLSPSRDLACSANTTIIDRSFLKTNGNTFIWLNKNGIKISTTLSKLPNRAWNHRNF